MTISSDPWAVVIFLNVVVFAAAILRGYTGFGFGMFAVPLASTVLDPTRVVPIVMSLQVLSGLLTLQADREYINRTSTLVLVCTGLPFVALGALALNVAPKHEVRLLVGCLTLAAAVMIPTMRSVRSMSPSKTFTALTGVTSGFLHGMVAMGGPPLTAFFLRGWFPPTIARASMTFVFTIYSIGPLIINVANGSIDFSAAIGVAFLFPALFIGTKIGGRIFRLYPQRHKIIGTSALGATGAIAIITAIHVG
ncbi:sulfite exporter TauE/SafE family protein [Paraburkholderia caribensis]|uniref:sulfite exporter TauE/SafE family protein n=1 Tax=Paraburkholderia TaxID=1822464 RepID=UPI001CB1003D|nr:sulfite exporter TauE/SafE family protein [Paraburkholderia sp. 22B1P]CAG9262475.1 putative membrane transporter protein [Paraburkholderia caribensis]